MKIVLIAFSMFLLFNASPEKKINTETTDYLVSNLIYNGGM